MKEEDENRTKQAAASCRRYGKVVWRLDQDCAAGRDASPLSVSPVGHDPPPTHPVSRNNPDRASADSHCWSQGPAWQAGLSPCSPAKLYRQPINPRPDPTTPSPTAAADTVSSGNPTTLPLVG